MPGLRRSAHVLPRREREVSFHSPVSSSKRLLSLVLTTLFLSALVYGQNTAAVIHPGDIIDVDLVGSLEYDWRGPLNSEGELDGFVAYDKSIGALCRDEAAVAADIVAALSRIFRDPQVVVRIIDSSGRPLARLEGAVRTPTRFSIRRPVRLRELIVLAGGFTDAATGEVQLVRAPGLSCPPQDNGANITLIRIQDLVAGKPEADPVILSGDIVTVRRSAPIYIIGAVVNPRPLYPPDEITVRRAIASVGGLTKDAAATAYILRTEGGETASIEVSLSDIKNGTADDVVLRQFDILDVPTKRAGKRTYAPVTPPEERSEAPNGDLPLRVVE